MRRISLLLLITMSPLLTMGQLLQNDGTPHHCFFKPHSLVGGVAIIYSHEFSGLGVNSRLYYNITDKLCLGPEASFIAKNGEQLKELNLVAHYIFDTRLVGLYPIVGINYSHERILDVEQDWGLVWGAGLHRNVKRINFFVEFSATESSLSDRFVKTGFLYMF